MALVIILMAILAGFAFQAILRSVSVYTTSSRNYLMVAQEGRIAMEKMIREIRETTPGRITINSETISFTKHTGTYQDSNLSVTFTKNGSKIERITSAGTFDLVDNISIFNPGQDIGTNVVTIDFTLSKGDPATTTIRMRSAVWPRQPDP